MHDIRLSIFIAVVEKGTFSAAAESLHITQPAITVVLQQLKLKVASKLEQSGFSFVNLYVYLCCILSCIGV